MVDWERSKACADAAAHMQDMADITRKKNTGEPGNPGEFGSKLHAEAEASLPFGIIPPAVRFVPQRADFELGAVAIAQPMSTSLAHLKGRYVKIVRELGDDERDADVGRVFAAEVSEAPGEEITLFEDELLDFERFDLESVRVSEEQWEKNGRMGPKKGSTQDQRCLVCNRPVADYGFTGTSKPNSAQVHVSTDGNLLPADLDLYDTWESQGAFSVGSECIKRIPAKFRG